MPTRYAVGPSSYSDGTSTSPRGVMQYVTSLIVALQVASLCYEFDTQFPGARARGDRLTVNEGIREKARQWALRLAYELYLRGGPWAALAAFCTWGPPEVWTSTHRPEVGTALDFGITQKDGTNRAMTAAEAAWVDTHGPRRGILPTGNSFARPERWHKNGGYGYTVPPIPGVNLPGRPFYTSTPAEPGEDSTPDTREDDDIMRFTVEYKNPAKPVKAERTVTLWVGARSILLGERKHAGRTWTVDQQIAVLRKWYKSSATAAATLATQERQLVQIILRSLK